MGEQLFLLKKSNGREKKKENFFEMSYEFSEIINLSFCLNFIKCYIQKMVISEFWPHFSHYLKLSFSRWMFTDELIFIMQSNFTRRNKTFGQAKVVNILVYFRIWARQKTFDRQTIEQNFLLMNQFSSGKVTLPDRIKTE